MVGDLRTLAPAFALYQLLLTVVESSNAYALTISQKNCYKSQRKGPECHVWNYHTIQKSPPLPWFVK